MILPSNFEPVVSDIYLRYDPCCGIIRMTDRKLYIDLFDTLADFEGAIEQGYGGGSRSIDPSLKYGKSFPTANLHICI